jgi:cyclic beta-1,2-glucan synthetase
MLSTLRVQTSNSGFDRLVNDWLPYQVFTSHLWGRLGPSQRSGGYGYRDQLQAALPLLFINPAIARSQILLHSAQQFFYGGDVLQWWHQSWEGKSGLGARNRASDPHLWLPYLVYHYIEATGDDSILDEEVPFLERRRIPRDREGVMFAPRQSPDSAKLYVHCIKAINLTLERMGGHGLPLLGTGDWNDGLSLVGSRGRGESVWLGFFLYDIISHFSAFIGRREGEARQKYYLDRAAQLRRALDAMWRDGRYVRAITDTGEEMTFADALNAAWPAISGAADFDRAAAAVHHGLRELEKEHLVLLLSPPFTEHSRPYPGKIADYPPGVRENGGQYSHGTSWLVDALAQLAARAAAGEQAPWRAAHYRARALAVWSKISPLAHTEPETIQRYGLPPHQQPADIYYGYGYEGRGGWSWYTGAAARMLFAAYQILGLTMKNGELVIPDDLFTAQGSLQVQRLIYKGRHYVPGG